jgi:hypothetical protein
MFFIPKMNCVPLREACLKDSWENGRGRRGRDHVIVWFITTYAISAYHHSSCDFESRSGDAYSVCTALCDKICQWLVIIDGFHRVLRFPPPIKLDIDGILMTMALNSIPPSPPHTDKLKIQIYSLYPFC